MKKITGYPIIFLIFTILMALIFYPYEYNYLVKRLFISHNYLIDVFNVVLIVLTFAAYGILFIKTNSFNIYIRVIASILISAVLTFFSYYGGFFLIGAIESIFV